MGRYPEGADEEYSRVPRNICDGLSWNQAHSSWWHHPFHTHIQCTTAYIKRTTLDAESQDSLRGFTF